MKSFSSWYTQTSEFLDDRPDWRSDWKWLVVIALAGYAVTLAVRLLDAPNWAAPQLMAGGERILASHDAYAWLAGAKGVNPFAPYGMSVLARGLAWVTGAPLWKIAFWAPAFLGSLSAVGASLWGWILGGRRTAIAAGCLGALSQGFYFRSRLGYYDSDVFTLLMPLLLGFMLAHLLSFCCTRAWLAAPRERQEGGLETFPAALPWLALGYGLVARIAHFAHDDIQPLGVALFWIALALAALTGRPGRRLEALRLLIVYGLAAYGGDRNMYVGVFLPTTRDIVSLMAAAGLAAFFWRRPGKLRPVLDHPWVWVAALAALVFAGDLWAPIGPFWAKVASYLKPVADAAAPGSGAGVGAAAGPVYPGITQSIREAKNLVDWPTFFTGVSVSPWAGALGGVGLIALLALRPGLALLLPFLILGFGSRYMGIRFVMFGGPVFALGLGIGVHWLAKALLSRTGVRPGALTLVQVLLAAACLAGYVGVYKDYRPTPVLAAPHAEALMKLKSVAAKDATVWTWWDFGYATQYYAERMTPTDGGKHGGRDIYPTALALMTPSYRQAAQVMLLSAGLDHDPARRWDRLPAQEVAHSLAGLALADQPLPKVPTQYLVVCWENVALLYWLGFYGSWDLAAGRGVHAKTQIVGEAFNVDQDRGLLVFRSSAPIPIKSVDVLSARGARRMGFPANQAGPHLVINEMTRQAMLMDDLAYNSMAVQLLVGDPSRPEQARYFKLVHEGFPLVRIYEVLPPAVAPQGRTEAFTQ